MVLDSHKFKYPQVKISMVIFITALALCNSSVITLQNTDEEKKNYKIDNGTGQSTIKILDTSKSNEESSRSQQSPIIIQDPLKETSKNIKGEDPILITNPKITQQILNKKINLNTLGENETTILPKIQPINLGYPEYLNEYKPSKLRLPDEQKSYGELTYTSNLEKINTNNEENSRAINMGLNMFTDVQKAQFDRQFNRLEIPASVKQLVAKQKAEITQNNRQVYTVPPHIIIDWSCKASNVLTQGACGISYISSPVEAVLITMKIYNATILPLSLQEILSCNQEKEGKNGCINGFFTSTYKYIEKFGVGQSPLYFYDDKAKYEGQVSDCKRFLVEAKTFIKYKVFIQESKRIRYGDCEDLVKQLRFRAISVSIAANGFQFYMEGTFHTNSTQINHGVTLVGYHPNKGYLIKNTWGIIWGMYGYGFVSSTTGICNYAYYPVLKQQIGTPTLCSPQV